MKLTTLKTRLSPLPRTRLEKAQAKPSQGMYDYRWQQARLRHLRKEPLCRMCKAQGRDELATIVDHIIPHRGDPKLLWDGSNWQSLCATHHSSDKQREENANINWSA